MIVCIVVLKMPQFKEVYSYCNLHNRENIFTPYPSCDFQWHRWSHRRCENWKIVSYSWPPLYLLNNRLLQRDVERTVATETITVICNHQQVFCFSTTEEWGGLISSIPLDQGLSLLHSVDHILIKRLSHGTLVLPVAVVIPELINIRTVLFTYFCCLECEYFLLFESS